MIKTIVALIALASIPTPIRASLDDFVALDDVAVEKMNKEIGNDATSYFVHADINRAKEAPIIQVLVMDATTHSFAEIGSYAYLKESLRGRNDIESLLNAQFWLRNQFGEVAELRVESFDFIDEASTFMLISHYAENDGTIWQQFQMLQWAEDESRKCVIASEIQLRLAAYYEDSISGAMADLLTYCAIGLNQ